MNAITIKGRVIIVDERFLSFSLNHNGEIIVVHMCLLFCQNPNTTFLPLVDEIISIINPHYEVNDETGQKVLFLSETTQITAYNGRKPNLNKNHLLFELASNFKLNQTDLHLLHLNYTVVLENLLDKSAEAYELVVEIFQSNNKKMLQTVSHHMNKYINTNNSNTQYKDFPYFSHGSHEVHNLLGFFFVDENNGITTLQDLHYSLPCLIMNKCMNDNLNLYLNKYVLIRKCSVITEIYNNNNAQITIPNLQYFVVNFQDILCLNSTAVPVIKEKENERFYYDLPEEITCKLSNSLTFELITKSTVSLSATGLPECWFEVRVFERNKMPFEKTILLCFNKPFLYVTALMEIGFIYSLHYNDILKKVAGNIELKRLKPDLSCYDLNDNAIIVYNNKMNNPPNVLSIPQLIATNTVELINFESAIKIKSFTKALSSRTRPIKKLQEFGLPGPKTHCIEFAIPGDNIKTICLYLNNWENTLKQLGLIEGMHVRIYNVIYQRRYIKSTALTYIKILNYTVTSNFCSANLCTEGDWGKPFPLGNGHDVPLNVVVWNRPSSIEVTSVTLKRSCLKCGKLSTQCACCGESKKTSLDIKLVVSDEAGECTVISECMELFQIILGLNKEQFKEMEEHYFDHIGLFEYNFMNTSNEIITEDSISYLDEVQIVQQVMLHAIKSFDEFSICELDLMCRKQCSDIDSKPLMACIRVRNSFESN